MKSNLSSRAYRFLFFLLVIVGVGAFPAYAQDVLIFDSTDHYLGGCQVTDTATWTIDKDMDVTTFQIWYSWNSGESSLPVTLSKDGKKIAEFTAKRSSCDPYQKQWCNADYSFNQTLLKGTYTTTIPNKRMCLKPGRTGTVRLYGSAEKSDVVETPVPVVSERVVLPTAIPTIIPQAPAAKNSFCSCSQMTIVATAAGTAIVTSLIVSFLMKKKV